MKTDSIPPESNIIYYVVSGNGFISNKLTHMMETGKNKSWTEKNSIWIMHMKGWIWNIPSMLTSWVSFSCCFIVEAETCFTDQQMETLDKEFWNLQVILEPWFLSVTDLLPKEYYHITHAWRLIYCYNIGQLTTSADVQERPIASVCGRWVI